MQGVDPYLETKVMTAQPHQLHMMVVDGAIRFATRAEQALAEQDFETAHFALNDARGFVSEMISGLQEEHAPELVQKLKSLFGFVFLNLVEADRDQDVVKVRDALKILRIHRETWAELGDTLAESADPASPVSTEQHVSQSFEG